MYLTKLSCVAFASIFFFFYEFLGGKWYIVQCSFILPFFLGGFGGLGWGLNTFCCFDQQNMDAVSTLTRIVCWIFDLSYVFIGDLLYISDSLYDS